MLKKHGWIAALFVAVAMVFMACPPPDNGGGGGNDRDEEYHWLLSEDFFTDERLENAVEEGWLNETTGLITWADRQDFFEPELAAASSEAVQTFTIVENGDKLALEVYTGTATWGVGFDLQNSFFNFQEGDKIKITGRVTAGTASPMFASATAGAGETHIATVGGDGSFEINVELSQANVSAIRTASGDSPAAFRIGAKPAGVRFVIYEIEIITVGFVPDGPIEVEAITGVTTSGFNGYPFELGGNVAPALAPQDIVWSKKVEADNYTLTAGGLFTPAAAGTFIVVATVADGLESGDYTEEFTITISEPATDVGIMVDGTAQRVDIEQQGDATVAVLPDGTGYKITIGTGQYHGSWAKFVVDLGSETLVDFEKVSFQIKSTSPDGTGGWKNLYLLAATDSLAIAANPPTGAALVSGKGSDANSNDLNKKARSLYLDYDKANAVTGNEIEIAIFVSAETGWSFEITDIAFTIGEKCDVCGKFKANQCNCCDLCGQQTCACTLVFSADISEGMLPKGAIADPALAIINAARDDSVIRVTIQNNNAADRTGWGSGHVGGVTINGAGISPNTIERDIVIGQMSSRQTDIYNDQVFVKFELWVKQAPTP